jgi:hypothetical protein
MITCLWCEISSSLDVICTLLPFQTIYVTRNTYATKELLPPKGEINFLFVCQSLGRQCECTKQLSDCGVTRNSSKQFLFLNMLVFLEFSSLRLFNLFVGFLDIAASVSRCCIRSCPLLEHSPWPLYPPKTQRFTGLVGSKGNKSGLYRIHIIRVSTVAIAWLKVS